MASIEKLPDLFVLDTLANDVESVDDILRMLNSETELGWTKEWGRSFTREDVVTALSRLVRDDLARAYATTGDGSSLGELPVRALPTEFHDAYFGMTPRGRLVHGNWSPNGAGGTGS